MRWLGRCSDPLCRPDRLCIGCVRDALKKIQLDGDIQPPKLTAPRLKAATTKPKPVLVSRKERA
jgi:hypothetical protein